ncbi:MAG: hypothetical protein QOJ76_1326 [Acidobacteriota bacterium]|nr:hypothetical protein [Acidobacteriota bacterium]
MKTRRRFPVSALALILSIAAFPVAFHNAPAARAAAQGQQYGALERGYRTGYSDGYQSGWADQLRGAGADYRGKPDYAAADRAYIAAYGALEDYRDGYQQGYEIGYEAGFNRRGFASDLPAGGVTRRGATQREAAEATDANGTDRGGRPGDAIESVSQGGSNQPGQPSQQGRSVGGASVVPSNAVLTVELLNRLSTDVSQSGDRFEAQVVEPQEFAGAVVGGHLANVQRPGKSKGRSLLQLDFDQIKMPGGDWQEFSAQVIEVVASEGTGGGEVDPEGGVRGKSTTKDDVAKVGASAGIGAIIGAIAGGGKGAAIGAVIGGGASTAGVMTQRGKDIRLERGQQLRIRTTSRGR